MRLPQNQLDEIEELCGAGKKVVVLFGGSPVELPFSDKVSAILNMYLLGQNGGTAVFDLLFSVRNPSGKLAETWVTEYGDVPSHGTFGKRINEDYAEGTDVGYRYYGKHGIPVKFPFGSGLSYTTFEKTEWIKNGDTYEQTVTNTGNRYGAEVAQLYVDGELKGFEKVRLQPGESMTVRIKPEADTRVTYSEEYTVPEEPPKFPVTLESRFTDLKQTFTGRILYNAVMSVPKKQMKKAMKMPAGAEKDNAVKDAEFLKQILENNSLRTMTMCSGGAMPFNLAEGSWK